MTRNNEVSWRSVKNLTAGRQRDYKLIYPSRSLTIPLDFPLSRVMIIYCIPAETNSIAQSVFRFEFSEVDCRPSGKT